MQVVGAGTRDTSAFAGHDLDELGRGFARFGIGAEQGYVFLVQVGDLDAFDLRPVVVRQEELYGAHHASGLCEAVGGPGRNERNGERIGGCDFDTQAVEKWS